MADARDDERIFLVDPDRRGVIPLDGFHVPRRLARTVRADRFQVRIDTAFDAVIEACAAARPGRMETWINEPIQALYGELYRARPGPQRRVLARAASWSAASMASRWAGPSSARACSR